MELSKTTIPHLYVDIEADASAAQRRAQEHGVPVTVSMIEAVSAALHQEPSLNGVWREGGPELSSEVNVGLAVDTPDGLLAPTIAVRPGQTTEELAAIVRAAVERARSGRLNAEDLLPATFTMSNIGKFGVRSGTSIIVPPQLAILCVGAIRAEAVVIDDVITIRPRVVLTLSADHRGVDGSAASRCLADIAERFGRVGES